MARRTVLTSNFNRRAISFFGTPSTTCRWRTSAHWDILITSASSWFGRRDDRVSPRLSSPGNRCFRVLRGSFFKWPRGPFSCCRARATRRGPPPPGSPRPAKRTAALEGDLSDSTPPAGDGWPGRRPGPPAPTGRPRPRSPAVRREPARTRAPPFPGRAPLAGGGPGSTPRPPPARRCRRAQPWVAELGQVGGHGPPAAGRRGKDTDENYLAVWQARETVENGLRLGAVGNLISTTVLSVEAAERPGATEPATPAAQRFAARGGPRGRAVPRLARPWCCGRRTVRPWAGVEPVTALSGRVGLASELTSRGRLPRSLLRGGLIRQRQRDYRFKWLIMHRFTGIHGDRIPRCTPQRQEGFCRRLRQGSPASAGLGFVLPAPSFRQRRRGASVLMQPMLRRVPRVRAAGAGWGPRLTRGS